MINFTLPFKRISCFKSWILISLSSNLIIVSPILKLATFFSPTYGVVNLEFISKNVTSSPKIKSTPTNPFIPFIFSTAVVASFKASFFKGWLKGNSPPQ